MYKLFCLAVLLSFTSVNHAAFADDTTPATPGTPPAASADTAPVAKGDTKQVGSVKTHVKTKGKAGSKNVGSTQGTHDRGVGKRSVMALSSLTDKQKSQLQAIYDEKKPEWDALSKQMHALRQAEWEKVKPILTADQLSELHANKNKARAKKREADSSAQ